MNGQSSSSSEPAATVSGVEWSASIGQLAAALAPAQAAIRPATKSAVNPHYRSRYADLASVWAACREPLTQHELAVVQLASYDPVSNCVSVTTVLLHSSGEYIKSTLRAPVAKSDAQAVGSAITYCRRYGLAAMVGVAPDDDDGEAASQPAHNDGVEVTCGSAPTRSPVWTVGDKAGTPLRDLSDEQLLDGREWCVGKNKKKFAELIGDIDHELKARGLEDVESTA